MLNVLSLFSGIGAFEKALDNLSIPYNLLNYCEIDKYASKAYSAIHGVSEELNLQDVTKVDPLDILDDVDFITYGFPCQDISNAGKQRGFTDEEGNRTRSGLFFEALRIIEDFKPKFAIAENVKVLTSKKFTEEFRIVLESLEEAGYSNYWQVLNAKDFGIPQNRERVFIISIRKDIDKGFEFPTPIPLELRLKDMLEDEVDEKYYLSDKTIDSLIVHKARNQAKGNGFGWKPSDGSGVAHALKTEGGYRQDSNFIADNKSLEKIKEKSELIKVGNTTPSGKSQCNTVYDENGIHPTLCAGNHGNCNPSVLVREATKKGYAEATPGDSVNLEQPNSKTRRGRVGKGVAQTLTTSCNQAVVLSKDEIDDFLNS